MTILDDLPKEGFRQGKALIDCAAVIFCKWCKKGNMLTNAAEHINNCLKVKKDKANRKKAAREARERLKEQQQREEERRLAEEEGIILGGDGESGDEAADDKGPAGKSTKKFGGKKAEGDVKGKKRKADGEPDKGPKQKKKKDEPKPKTKPKGESIYKVHRFDRVPTHLSAFSPARVAIPIRPRQTSPLQHPLHIQNSTTKPQSSGCRFMSRCLLLQPMDDANYALGPVDVERQCGVVLANGQPCARSLTCKSHSMGAKRAVAGRSLPYDMLLAAYQKKNQARQQSKSSPSRSGLSPLTMS